MTTIPMADAVRAIYELYARNERWPTTQDVAVELELGITDAHQQLAQLRREGLFLDRIRDGKKVWLPVALA